MLSLVYIDRILKLHGDFNVSILNIHRLLITSVMLAAKFFDDVYYSNKHYARVGGVRTREINLLETQFLTLINYHLFVSPQEYDQYRRNVLAAVRYARNLPSGPSRFSSESSSSAAAAASASAGEAAQLEAPRQEQSRAADASQETGKTGDGTTTTKDPKATGSAPGPGGGGLEHGGNGASRRRVEAAHATGGHSANSSSRPRTAKSFTASWNCSSSASPDEGGSTCSGRGTDSSYTNNAVVGLRSNSHSSLGVRLGTGVSDYQHCEGKRVEEGVTTGGRASPVDPRAPVFPQRSAGSSQHCRQEDTLASAGMGSLQAVRPSGVSRSSHRRRPDLNASRGPSLRAGTAAGDEPAEVEEGVARTPKRSEKHHKKQEGSRESRGNAAVHAVEECRDHRSSPAAAEEEEMPSARRHSEFRRQKQVDDSDVEQRISYAVEAAQWSESRGEEDDAYYGRQKDGRAASVAVDEEDTWVEEETMDIAGGPAGEHRERIAFSSRHSPAHTDFPCFDYVRAPAQDQVGGKNECRCCSMPPRASVLSASSGAASSCGCEGGSDMALTRCTACGCGTGTARHVATKACGEHAGGTDAISARGPSQQSQHDLCRSRRSLADRGGFMVDRFSREAAVTVRGTGSSDAGSRTAGVVLASGSVGGGMASEAGRGQKDHQLYTAAVMAGAEVPASSSSTASGSTNGTTQSSVSSCLTPSQSIHSSPDVSMDEESGVAIAVAAGNAASSRALRGTEEDVGGANVPFFSRKCNEVKRPHDVGDEGASQFPAVCSDHAFVYVFLSAHGNVKHVSTVAAQGVCAVAVLVYTCLAGAVWTRHCFDDKIDCTGSFVRGAPVLRVRRAEADSC